MKEKINQTAGRLKQTVRAVGVGIATLTASFFMSAPAYAAGVQDSQIVKGTEKLVGDVTTWLMVLAPVVAGLLTIGNKMPLLEYVKKLSPSHPARALLSISDVAPSRTRGSFYTSALTTLRLFTSKSIYAITHTSDFK